MASQSGLLNLPLVIFLDIIQMLYNEDLGALKRFRLASKTCNQHSEVLLFRTITLGRHLKFYPADAPTSRYNTRAYRLRVSKFSDLLRDAGDLPPKDLSSDASMLRRLQDPEDSLRNYVKHICVKPLQYYGKRKKNVIRMLSFDEQAMTILMESLESILQSLLDLQSFTWETWVHIPQQVLDHLHSRPSIRLCYRNSKHTVMDKRLLSSASLHSLEYQPNYYYRQSNRGLPLPDYTELKNCLLLANNLKVLCFGSYSNNRGLRANMRSPGPDTNAPIIQILYSRDLGYDDNSDSPDLDFSNVLSLDKDQRNTKRGYISNLVVTRNNLDMGPPNHNFQAGDQFPALEELSLREAGEYPFGAEHSQMWASCMDWSKLRKLELAEAFPSMFAALTGRVPQLKTLSFGLSRLDRGAPPIDCGMVYHFLDSIHGLEDFSIEFEYDPFHQISLGLELLNKVWEALINKHTPTLRSLVLDIIITYEWVNAELPILLEKCPQLRRLGLYIKPPLHIRSHTDGIGYEDYHSSHELQPLTDTLVQFQKLQSLTLHFHLTLQESAFSEGQSQPSAPGARTSFIRPILKKPAASFFVEDLWQKWMSVGLCCVLQDLTVGFYGHRRDYSHYTRSFPYSCNIQQRWNSGEQRPIVTLQTSSGEMVDSEYEIILGKQP